MIKYFVFFICFLLLGCSEEQAEKIEFQISSGEVNLSSELPGDWDTVCVLVPYTTNEIASKQLGFEYNVMKRSGISVLDGISLLVTTKSNAVVGEYEVPRNNADFASLGANCYSRENSHFNVQQTTDGWNRLENI